MIAITPQIVGVMDDGNEAGASRAKLVRGNLVPVPFRTSMFVVENTGAVTASFQDTGITDNPDGSNTGIFVSVAADAARAGKGARIRFAFYGRVFGIRYRRDSTVPATFSVGVDGVYYSVTGPNTFIDTEVSGLTDNECDVIVVDDLVEGVHYADVTVTADTAVTRTVTFYGYLAEDRAGYRQMARYLTGPSAPGTLTNAALAIPKLSTTAQLRAVRQVLYVNTSGGAITVTAKLGGVAFWSAVLAAAGSAGCSATLDFGGLMTLGSTHTHEASAGASVNFFVIGGS